MPPSKSIVQQWTEKIKMFGQLSKPIHFIKIIVGYLVITIIALSPILVGFLGGNIEHYLTGKKIHEGNSIFAAVFWLMFYTIPFGILLLVFWTSIVVKSMIQFFKNDN